MPFNMPEGVKLLELDPAKMQDLWNKMNTIPGILDDFHKDNPQAFVQQLQSRDTVWLERTDGNGILYLTNVVRGLSATGHILYWDKKLRGREQFTLDTLKWLTKAVPLLKVNVFLPEFAKAAEAFTQRLGFRKEGVLRRWSVSQGKPFDMLVYGILAEELMAMEAPNGVEQSTGDTDIQSAESGIRGDGDGPDESVPERPEHPTVVHEYPSA